MASSLPSVPIRGYPGKSPTPQGPYDPEQIYAQLDIVRYSNAAFISTSESNQGNTPSDTSPWWMLLIDGSEVTQDTTLDGGSP